MRTVTIPQQKITRTLPETLDECAHMHCSKCLIMHNPDDDNNCPYYKLMCEHAESVYLAQKHCDAFLSHIEKLYQDNDMDAIHLCGTRMFVNRDYTLWKISLENPAVGIRVYKTGRIVWDHNFLTLPIEPNYTEMLETITKVNK